MKIKFIESKQNLRLIALILGFGSVAASAQTTSLSTSTSPSDKKPIIKMTTHNGQVIYTDRALNGVKAKTTQTINGAITDRVLATAGETKSPDSSPPKKTDGASGSNDSATNGSKKEQENGEKKQAQEIKDAKAAVAKINCDNAKANLQTLNAGRPSLTNEKGETNFLTDAQIAEQKSQAQKMINQHCS